MSAKVSPKTEVKAALAPIDLEVKIPRQVRWDAARAERYYQSESQYCPLATPSAIPSKLEIDEVIERWASQTAGALFLTDQDFRVVQYVLRDYARLKSASRKGGQRQRQPAPKIMRRWEATVEVYRGLSPKLQKNPTGVETIKKLRAGVINTLGMADDGNVLPEEVVRKDVNELRIIFKCVRDGIIPFGKRPTKPHITDAALPQSAGTISFQKWPNSRLQNVRPGIYQPGLRRGPI